MPRTNFTSACVVLGLIPLGLVAATPASARTCKQLRALCFTMRDDKSDCTRPYQRCLATGTFITPLGRVFKATN